MVKAEFVYEVLLTYDIDVDHTEIVKKKLVEEYGFMQTVKVSSDNINVIDYLLPESTLYHPHTSTDSATEIFKKVCIELGVTRLSCIVTKCDEARALLI